MATGEAILKLERRKITVRVELPDDVIKEFILEAMAGTLGFSAIGGNGEKSPEASESRLAGRQPPEPKYTPIRELAEQIDEDEKRRREKISEARRKKFQEKVRKLAEKLKKLHSEGRLGATQAEIMRQLGIRKHYKLLRQIAEAAGVELPPPRSGVKAGLTEEAEKEILRQFYIEKKEIDEIARDFNMTEKKVIEVVTSERGKRYQAVNAEIDWERLRQSLKQEVAVMQELTKDAAGGEVSWS